MNQRLFIACAESVLGHVLVAHCDGIKHVYITIIELHDDGADLFGQMGDQRLDVQLAVSKRPQFNLAIKDAPGNPEFFLGLFEDTVLYVDQDGSVCKDFEHFDGIFGAKVGGPEGVYLEFDLWAKFGIDLVFEFAIQALELKVMVMLEKQSWQKTDKMTID